MACGRTPGDAKLRQPQIDGCCLLPWRYCLKRCSTVTLLILFAVLCTFPLVSIAQKKSSAKRRTPAAKPTPTPDFRAEAQQVAEQIKNFSKFIYIYGKVVNGLEIADDQARRGQMSPTAAEKNRQSKDALVANIRGLKIGADNLAKSFQSNPKLQVQYLKLTFAVDAAAEAEQLAGAGRYDEAGKSLVTVIERLTDAVIALR